VRFGISVANFARYADPELIVRWAGLAETSSWDGFFLWDHIAVAEGWDHSDPWVELGAIAQVTDRIAIGPMVTPLPRRRPWVVARQATTVDHLSGGRLILGVGIGNPPEEEFGRFGEPTDDRERADLLDEGLEILKGMWSGEPYSHSGEHLSVARSTFGPTPVQQPTIPIWVAAMWPNRRPMRRAARFEGVFPFKMGTWSVDEVLHLASIMNDFRGDLEGFDLVISGSFLDGSEFGGEYADAGATWYLAVPRPGDTVDDVEAAIRRGPSAQ